MLNNKGQSLVLFVLLMPIILGIIVLVIDVGKSLVEKNSINNKIDLNDEKNLEWIFAILYFIIGTPKDVITYFAGITKIKFGVFMVISTLCRIPSILTSAIAGQALGEENYILSVIIFAVSAVIAVLGYLIYHRISKRKEESGV